jgi:VWFA-related protein
MLLRNSSAVLVLAAFIVVAHAQVPTQSPASNQQPYTLHADSRVVLTDVTVTDAKGNPVHGLSQSAFHIFDNKQLQNISSFEEHTAAAPPAPAYVPVSGHGEYSNDFLLHLPPVLNVMVIDLININIEDQIYLNYEFGRFFEKMPLNQPLAIYLRGGDRTFLLQNFTTDRKLLLDAVHKAIPRFPPHGREYLSDMDTMQEVAASLSQYPGRKNVLWFTGGSTFFLRPDGAAFENEAGWRAIYDELEQERIAIYPIDVRGLVYYMPGTSVQRMFFGQHGLMNDVAAATGGKAYYNTNGLDQATAHILDTGESFYTLTYSPHSFRFDNKWHSVKVKVDGASYHLSYRTGYFADGSVRAGESPAKVRTHITVGGGRFDEAPELHSVPIIFNAQVLPASDPAVAALPKPTATLTPSPMKGGAIPFAVRYTLSLNALTQQTVDGKPRVVFGVASFAYNREGTAVDRHADRLSMVLNPEMLRLHPDAPVSIDQQLNLSKGDEYVYLAIWDMNSGRIGTLQIPLDVQKPPKEKKGN